MAKYFITYRVSGIALTTIDTEESPEDVNERLCSEVNSDNFDIELDEIHDVDIDIAEAFLVERSDGKRVWTTYVRATDKLIGEENGDL